MNKKRGALDCLVLQESVDSSDFSVQPLIQVICDWFNGKQLTRSKWTEKIIDYQLDQLI